VCNRFGVISFESVQEFNGDDFGFGALVFSSMCMKTSRLSSTTSDRSGKGVAIVVRWWLALAAGGVRWSKDLIVIFIMFKLLCTSCELMQ
jgi:hypothetical protein